MGWNTIYNLKSDLFKDIAENEYMYLVTVFMLLIALNRLLLQIMKICFGMQKNNFTEPISPRKGDVGEKIFGNFEI
jgi:glutamine amidotransferase